MFHVEHFHLCVFIPRWFLTGVFYVSVKIIVSLFCCKIKGVFHVEHSFGFAACVLSAEFDQ